MNLWGFVFGQDVKVKMLKGSLEEVLSEIRDLSPVKDLGVIRESLNKAVWSEEVQWLGGHQVGLEVLSVASDPTVWSLLPKAVGAN
jgi:hypothetical protein